MPLHPPPPFLPPPIIRRLWAHLDRLGLRDALVVHAHGRQHPALRHRRRLGHGARRRRDVGPRAPVRGRLVGAARAQPRDLALGVRHRRRRRHQRDAAADAAVLQHALMRRAELRARRCGCLGLPGAAAAGGASSGGGGDDAVAVRRTQRAPRRLARVALDGAPPRAAHARRVQEILRGVEEREHARKRVCRQRRHLVQRGSGSGSGGSGARCCIIAGDAAVMMSRAGLCLAIYLCLGSFLLLLVCTAITS